MTTIDPVLVEESTPIKLASRLKDLVETLPQDAIHHDYTMALIIVVMNEAGFSLTSSHSTDIDSGYNKKLRTIPSDWKSEESGNYTLKFFLDQLPDREFKMVAIPNGDTLVVNLVFPNDHKKALSIALQTAKYVNVYSSDLAGRYLNLKEFTFRFKNEMTTPARCEILSAARMPSSSLSGIPAEIKLRILGILDVHSLVKLSKTSKEFFQLSGELKIWKNLLMRDFKSEPLPNTSARDSYKLIHPKSTHRVLLSTLNDDHLLTSPIAMRNIHIRPYPPDPFKIARLVYGTKYST